MPKVTDAHVEARRQQILEAAHACFARGGFHQTSIQDICQESGLSPGAVYKYFPSKEHIIAASCRECQQDLANFITAAKAQGSSPLESLDFIFDHGLEMLSAEAFRDGTIMNVQVWSEAMRSEEVREALLEGTFETLVRALTELFEDAQARGEVDPELDPRGLGVTTMGMFHGLVLHKSLDSQVDISACGDAMRALYHGLFRAAADAG